MEREEFRETNLGVADAAELARIKNDVSSSSLYNEDLAPATKRDWGIYSLFCMWMADVHSIGGYTFAAGLFFLGLNGWWVLAGLGVATFVVLGLMNLTGYAGQRLGVPYPVLARLSFGVLGANIPAIIRGLIAVAWYGIQTYLASAALDVVLLKLFPGLAPYADVDQYGFTGLSLLGWGSFTLLWILQAAVFWRGMPDSWVGEWETSIKRVLAMDWEKLIPGHPGPGGRRPGTTSG